VLLTPVVAHLETIRDALRHATAPALRRKLLANRARVATLAGRLAFFDLRDAMGARSYYNLALESAREAGDHHQAAAALGHVAFIPAADRGFTAALDYLQGAERHLAKHAHGPLSSWLAAVESEIHTNAGSHTTALAAIDRAREALARPGLVPSLPWFDYYDETRLAGFAGYATLRAGRFDESRTALTEALDRLPAAAVKQRAVFLTDLATVHLHDGDLDEACRSAAAAADELHRAGYATGSGRLQEFRAAVARWSTTPAVRMLDEQLALIA
jgi:tetratricopeptide (TPR) repeat protein